jgi:hypothetical protein
MNITDHVFEETKIAGQSRCVADTLTPLSTYRYPIQLDHLSERYALENGTERVLTVHVNFAKLHMQTAQTESGQSD